MLISSTIITDAIFIPYLPICIWYLQLGRYTVYGPRNRLLGKNQSELQQKFQFLIGTIDQTFEQRKFCPTSQK